MNNSIKSSDNNFNFWIKFARIYFQKYPPTFGKNIAFSSCANYTRHHVVSLEGRSRTSVETNRKFEKNIISMANRVWHQFLCQTFIWFERIVTQLIKILKTFIIVATFLPALFIFPSRCGPAYCELFDRLPQIFTCNHHIIIYKFVIVLHSTSYMSEISCNKNFWPKKSSNNML